MIFRVKTWRDRCGTVSSPPRNVVAKMAEVAARGDAAEMHRARSRVADMELVAIADPPDDADQCDDEDQGDCEKCRVNQDTILPLVSRANFAAKNLSGCLKEGLKVPSERSVSPGLPARIVAG